MKEQTMRNDSKPPKKIVGFQPSKVDDDAIFKMDEEHEHEIEQKKVEQIQTSKRESPASAAPPKSPYEGGNKESVTLLTPEFGSFSKPAPERRPSMSTVSPSVSFREQFFQTSRSTAAGEDDGKSRWNKTTPPPVPSEENAKKYPSKPKMSKAERRELQEQQRAEKAARIAAGGPAKRPPPVKSSPKVEFRPSKPKSVKKEKVPAEIIHDTTKSKVVTLFSHLSQFRSGNETLHEKASKKNIHPAVVSLGVQYSEGVIVGGNARCMAMLLAFSKVISDYNTPAGQSINRVLIQHIGRQIDFLTYARAMAPSMKTAINYIKSKITYLANDLPDEDAKIQLRESIEEFIQHRIILAQKEIVNVVLKNRKIVDGDVILTYGRSSTVVKLILEANQLGIKFKVIVVDGRPHFEGKETVLELSKANIDCTYIFTNSLPYVISKATKVIIGASSVLSNGDMMSRVGNSVVCMAANYAKVPVIAVCEIYKFSETVRLDAFVWNELGILLLIEGNPDNLVDLSNRAPSQRLPPCVPRLESQEITGDLKHWKEQDCLKLLNLSYDITPAKFINVVVCEMGLIPSTLVLSVLRSQSLQLM